MTEGLILVENCLTGFSLRKHIRLICSGKVTTGFGMLKRLAMGADLCYSSRGMMLALGCIQALKCNTNKCPVGLATQDPLLTVGLVVEDKDQRVANYHRHTIKSLADLLGAMGLKGHEEARPWHISRRVGLSQVKHYGEIYRFLNDGDLLREPLPEDFEIACRHASAESFSYV